MSVLNRIRNGAALIEIDEAMRGVVNAVLMSGKAGAVTVKLTVKPVNGIDDAVAISAEVADKRPAPETAPSVFFANSNGTLREGPRQTEMDFDEKKTVVDFAVKQMAETVREDLRRKGLAVEVQEAE